MARYQLIDADNRKINIIEWDGVSDLGELSYKVQPDDGTPLWTPVPFAVTPLQARKALRAVGLMDSVKAFLLTQPETVREEWEYAVTIERTNHVIEVAAKALNMTKAQIDDLFRLAATL